MVVRGGGGDGVCGVVCAGGGGCTGGIFHGSSSLRKQNHFITCLSRSRIFGGRLLRLHSTKVITVP